jgi:hypothetical protein
VALCLQHPFFYFTEVEGGTRHSIGHAQLKRRQIEHINNMKVLEIETDPYERLTTTKERVEFLRRIVNEALAIAGADAQHSPYKIGDGGGSIAADVESHHMDKPDNFDKF